MDGWWKSSCSGGQHGPWLWIRCGRLNNFENTAAAPCADPRGGSRNTSLPETGTTPGATPGTQEEPGNRTFTREPGTSSRSMNRQPAGQPAGQRPATGQGPCISYMRGPCHFRAEGLAISGRRPFRAEALPFPRAGPCHSRAASSASPAACRARRDAAATPVAGFYCAIHLVAGYQGRRESCLAGPAGAGRQSKEMDAINPESARTDVTLAFRAPAGRGTAADRERGAC